MLHSLCKQLQQWLEWGMPFSAPISPPFLVDKIYPINSEADSIFPQLPSSLGATTVPMPDLHYSMVSNQNVYHPRKQEMLLLRSGQVVSNKLLEKLCQFGINVATFCSLKEAASGNLHPITEETIAWLPASQAILQKAVTPKISKKTTFLGLQLPPAIGISSPFRTKFEETLEALKACPMPNLLVLNPLPHEQRKLGKLLEAIGLEYQQVRPVFTAETLPYTLRKYSPHTLIIDEAWWQTNGGFQKKSAQQQLEILNAFIADLISLLQTHSQPLSPQNLVAQPKLVFMLTPQVAWKTAIIQTLTSLNKLTTVKVLWKTCKRPMVQEALKQFFQTTQLQLEKRQEVPSSVR